MNEADVKAALAIVTILADTIRDLGRVPNGHLYARVMQHLTFENYTAAIATLKRTGLVEEKSHELIWKGPKD